MDDHGRSSQREVVWRLDEGTGEYFALVVADDGTLVEADRWPASKAAGGAGSIRERIVDVLPDVADPDARKVGQAIADSKRPN